MQGKIPCAGIADETAAEGFLILGKTIPRVLGVFGSGNAPEVEGFGAGFLSIENHLDEHGHASREIALGAVVSGGMSIETGAVMVVDKSGCDRLTFKPSDIERGKASCELMLEVGLVMEVEMIAFSDTLEKLFEDVDLLRVSSLGDGDALSCIAFPIAEVGRAHTLKQLVARDIEVEHPCVARVDVVRLPQAELSQFFCTER